MNSPRNFSDAPAVSALIQYPGWPKPLMLSATDSSICLLNLVALLCSGALHLSTTAGKTFPGRNLRTCKIPILFFLKNHSPELCIIQHLKYFLHMSWALLLFYLHQQGQPSITFSIMAGRGGYTLILDGCI